MNMKKHIYLFVTSIFLIFTISGCKNLLDFPKEKTFITITGTIDSPENKSTSSAASSRSAIPSAASSTVTYSVYYVYQSTTFYGTVTDKTFTIKIPADATSLELNVDGSTSIDADGKNNTVKIYEGSSTLNITDKNNIPSVAVKLSPVFSKNERAKVALPILISDTQITSIKATWTNAEGDEESWKGKYDSSDFNYINSFIFYLNKTNEDKYIPSLSYTVDFDFYKKDSNGKEYLAYYTKQQIDAGDYLLTEKWTPQASEICFSKINGTDVTAMVVNSAVCQKFLSTSFYVDSSSGSDTDRASGSYNNPFKTLQKVVNVISQNQDTGKTYSVYLKSNIEAASDDFTNSALVDLSSFEGEINIGSWPKNSAFKVDAKSLGRFANVGPDCTVHIKEVEFTGGDLDKTTEKMGSAIYNKGTVFIDSEKASIDGTVHIFKDGTTSGKLSTKLLGTDQGNLNSISISADSYENLNISIGSSDKASETFYNKLELYNKRGNVKVTEGSLAFSSDGVITGSIPVINFYMNLINKVYLGTSEKGQKITLRTITSVADTISDTSLTKWEKSKDKNTWVTVPCHVSGSVYYPMSCSFEIEEGTTYYRETVFNDFGTDGVSEICTVICDAAYNNMGKIFYSDKTYSTDYDNSKTPVGIVCAVDESKLEDGCYVPCKIVELGDSDSRMWWCTEDADGREMDLADARKFSKTDGSLNLQTLTEVCSDAITNLSKYPVFNYAKQLTENDTNGINWYIPAVDEARLISWNSVAINEGLKAIDSEKKLERLGNYYWTSSAYNSRSSFIVRNRVNPNPGYFSCPVRYSSSEKDDDGNDTTTGYGVRAIAKVEVETAAPLPNITHPVDTSALPEIPDSITSLTETTYVIKTEAQLKALAVYVNEGNTTQDITFVLGNNIKLSNTWTPIGIASEVGFQGNFEGNNYCITNLNVNGSEAIDYGLFGKIKPKLDSTSYVRNVIVEGKVVTSGDANSTGGVCGAVYDGANINNCITVVNCASSQSYCGGIAGYSDIEEITNCMNFGNIKSSEYVGGIIGMLCNYVSNSVSNCYNFGNVDTNDCGAGIAYTFYDLVLMDNCLNLGTVTCEEETAAPLVMIDYTDVKDSTISNSYYLEGVTTINGNTKNYNYIGVENGTNPSTVSSVTKSGTSYVLSGTSTDLVTELNTISTTNSAYNSWSYTTTEIVLSGITIPAGTPICDADDSRLIYLQEVLKR